jgi:hypothetical protein
LVTLRSPAKIALFLMSIGSVAVGALQNLPLGRGPYVGLPLTTASLQRAIAEMAWASGRPIGFEAVPAEPWQPTPAATTLNVMGKTVEEMLDALVARDVRYSWSEENAVLHLRPRASRRDSNSPLNRKIDAFAVRDVTLADASHEIHFLLQPELRGLVIVGSGIAAHQLGLRRFDVNIANTTVLGVLDAIVMAHGASSWHVTYSQTGDWLHIGFDTFDGWGTTW